MENIENLMKSQGYVDSMCRYLKDTDYVILKIQEADYRGDEELKESLKEEYKEILEKRNQIRSDLNAGNYYSVPYVRNKYKKSLMDIMMQEGKNVRSI